jgi:hypothetical protein
MNIFVNLIKFWLTPKSLQIFFLFHYSLKKIRGILRILRGFKENYNSVKIENKNKKNWKIDTLNWHFLKIDTLIENDKRSEIKSGFDLKTS